MSAFLPPELHGSLSDRGAWGCGANL